MSSQSSLIPGPQNPADDQRLYVIGNKILARGYGGFLGDYSIAIFCPHTGDVWGRIIKPGAKTWRLALGYSEAALGAGGDSAWAVPGSFIAGWAGTYLDRSAYLDRQDSFPPELWAREARLHLRWYEYEMTRRPAAGIMAPITN